MFCNYYIIIFLTLCLYNVNKNCEAGAMKQELY